MSELRELERVDADLAAGLERLQLLDAEVASIRAAAEDAAAFLELHEGEDVRRRAAIVEARAELERRQAERAEATRRVDAGGGEEAVRLAGLALARAVDHVDVARSALERAAAGEAELALRAEALPAAVAELERRAWAVANEASGVPGPGGGGSLVEWASHAHAALFVAAGDLATRRDRVIREANELASMLVGEPTYGSTVAQARARVEATRVR